MTRNVTVTFDDGSSHTYANAPDTVTPEQITARAGKDFAGKKVTHLDGGKEPEAGGPPVDKYPLTSMDPGWREQADRYKQEQFESAKTFGTHALHSAGESVGNVVNVAKHPIEAAKAIPGAIGGLINQAGQVLTHPGDTLEAAKKFLTNMDVGKAGDIVGTGIVGGGVGKVAGKVGELLGPGVKALSEKAGLGKSTATKEAVERLDKMGVNNMTPGMRQGGWLNALEQKWASIPFVGDFIKRARAKAGEQMNVALVNDALSHIKDKLPGGMKPGHEAIRTADDAFSAAYDKTLAKMTGKLDAQLTEDFNTVKETARAALPAAQAEAVAKTLDGVLKRFQPDVPGRKASRLVERKPGDPPGAEKIRTHEIGGEKGGDASGQAVKDMQQVLRQEIDDHMRSTNPADRKVGLALITAKQALSRMLERYNPALAAELKEIDRGYAKMTIAKVAAVSGNQDGIFTPRQGLRATRKQDRSKDKKKFARGEALSQQFMTDAVNILGATEADSGTAGRYLMAELTLGGVAAVTAHPVALGAAMAAPGLYSQPVMRALQRRALHPSGKGGKLPLAAGLGATQFPGTDQAGVAQ